MYLELALVLLVKCQTAFEYNKIILKIMIFSLYFSKSIIKYLYLK